MDQKSANKIVQGKMKNMEVSKTKRKKISSAANSDNKGSIQQSPSLEELQKKYLSLDDDGYRPSSAGSDSSGTSGNNEDDDVDVKIIVPKKKQSDASGPSKDRTVILSKKKGFLGSQG